MTKKHDTLQEYTTSSPTAIYPLGYEQDDTKFKLLEGVLQFNLSIDDRKALNKAASEFLMRKASHSQPLQQKNKDDCESLVNILHPAILKLEALEPTTEDRLCALSKSARRYIAISDIIVKGLKSIMIAAQNLKDQKPNGQRGRKPETPYLWGLINSIIPAYEKVTGERATAGIKKRSSFVRFSIVYIELIIEKNIPETFEDDTTVESFDSKEDYEDYVRDRDNYTFLDRYTQKRAIPEDTSTTFCHHTINQTIMDTISLRKYIKKLEKEIENSITSSETEKEALKIWNKAATEHQQKIKDFIKKKRRK